MKKVALIVEASRICPSCKAETGTKSVRRRRRYARDIGTQDAL